MITDYSVNRLMIVGPARDLKAFDADDRATQGSGSIGFHLLECSARRHAWQFESPVPPVAWLRRASRQWPTLVFLLDYDLEERRCVGLVKARRGRVLHHRIRY